MGVISRKNKSMKFIRKAVAWVFWFLFGWIIDWADNKIFVYKKRLQMVPVSFKWFVWILGVVVGASGMMIYQEAPVIMKEVTRASEPMVFVQQARAEILPVEVIEEVVAPEVDLVDVIFSKESSRGVNNYSKCEEIGKFNRYGFDIPGNGKYVCFEKDEDTKAVAGWVAHRKALGWTDNEILCYYNSGTRSESCGYLE